MSKRRNLSDMRTGRLTVLRDSGNRTKKGEIVWLCLCDCGALHHASTGNLVNGSVRSCGCLARELSSMRCRATARLPKACRYTGCGQSTEKGGHGYCGMHAQRVRRYGDPDYVTSADVLRANNRASQIKRFPSVKPNTYRKYFGRHEHRVIAETLVGRPLRSDEHVHHKDENKHNNSPENLVVLHPGEHAALHALQRKLEKC